MSSLLVDNNLQGLNMLDFLPIGGVIVAAGIAYMLLVGRHLLPRRESLLQMTLSTDLQETYQLQERMWEVRVSEGSPLVNTTLGQSGIGHELGLTVLAIWRGRQAIFTPKPHHVLRADDYLLVLGRKERLDRLLEWGTQLRNHPESHTPPHHFHVNLTEIIIPPRSQAIGQTITELELRRKLGVTVVAIWREGRSFRTDVGTMELRVGDALLVVGSPDALKKVATDRNYLMPGTGNLSAPARPQKAALSVVITATVLLLAIFEVFPIALVMLAGGVALFLTGCISLEAFYDAIEWKVIFLIAGILPLSIAIVDTGLADRVGTGFVDLLSGYHPLVIVMGIVLLTVLITQIIGGQVTALLIGPIAISTALKMNVSPQAMSVAVAIACSNAFLSPLAHPVNIIMMGPGGYQFNDFVKVGAGMTVVTLLALAFGLVVFWQVV